MNNDWNQRCEQSENIQGLENSCELLARTLELLDSDLITGSETDRSEQVHSPLGAARRTLRHEEESISLRYADFIA